MPRFPPTGSAVPVAMVGAAAILAQFVGGKATRDALFLARFDVTTLPVMVMAASVFSIACALLMSRLLRRVAPARVLPAAFLASGALFLLEWLFFLAYPRAGAVAFYLHMLGLAPVLVSGYWGLLSERFDPRTAKRRLGHIGAAATFGGLAGSVIADRAAVWGGASAMMPIVAIVNAGCAWAVWQLASTHPRETKPRAPAPGEPAAAAAPTGMAVLAGNAHLRNLAALVLLTTLGATLLDYVFKARAVAEIGRGDTLLRFFALYYGAQSVLTLLAQVTLARPVLERLGLAPAVGSPSLAVVAGGLGALALPGLASVAVARGAEYVCRTSLFRSAYELLYTPVSAAEKRAAKSIIDVAFDRSGDLAGAALTRLVLASAPAGQHSIILLTAVASSAAALFVARRVTRGYVETLERSLIDQAVRLDVSEIEDLTTRETLVRTLGPSAERRRQPAAAPRGAVARRFRGVGPGRAAHPGPPFEGPRANPPRAARGARTGPAARAARRSPPRVGPGGGRRDSRPAEGRGGIGRTARGLAAGPAAGLRDQAAHRPRALDLRVAARGGRPAARTRRPVRGARPGGRSLAAITERNGLIRIDPDRVYRVVLREVSVGRPVWESHRLLDAFEDGYEGGFVDRFIGERAGQSMAHVFTLLSLVLHREPLQIAFRGLHVEDALLRGTALEYLESVLPEEIRSRLWPFLEDSRPPGRPARTRDEIIADLLRSNESIVLNLAELERRGVAGGR